MAHQSNTQLMTQGNITKQILWFSLPLLIGNLFQQLYSTVDSIVIGNFVGDNALAAVNSSGPIIFLFISFFNGLAIGAGVAISKHYGAGNLNEVSKNVHTAIALTIVVSILLTIIGYFITPTILKIMNVDREVMHNSITYLQIYFLGSFGIITYNMGSGILRAVGDSRRPLYILIISCIINIVLDLVFVIIFGWAVFGVALATLIAQVVSAILVLSLLIKSEDIYHLEIKKIRFHHDSLKEIIRIGLPSAIQNMIVSLSNAVVQSNINSFGKYAMAGAGSYTKIDGFAILPVMSFSNALTTFVAQNMGAKKYNRVRKGIYSGLLLSSLITLTISLILFLFAHQILALFSTNPKVIDYGTLMMRSIVPGYIILAISHNLAGALRGSGQTKIPMFIMIFSWCICRITWITIMVTLFNDIQHVFMGWPITWVISTLLLLIYFKRSNWLKTEV